MNNAKTYRVADEEVFVEIIAEEGDRRRFSFISLVFIKNNNNDDDDCISE